MALIEQIDDGQNGQSDQCSLLALALLRYGILPQPIRKAASDFGSYSNILVIDINLPLELQIALTLILLVITVLVVGGALLGGGRPPCVRRRAPKLRLIWGWRRIVWGWVALRQLTHWRATAFGG